MAKPILKTSREGWAFVQRLADYIGGEMPLNEIIAQLEADELFRSLPVDQQVWLYDVDDLRRCEMCRASEIEETLSNHPAGMLCDGCAVDAAAAWRNRETGRWPR